MSDAERNLRIKISTEADTAKVQGYARATEELGRRAEVTAKRASAATAAWTRNKTKLSEAVRGLTAAFPGLARAFSLAVNPITLAVAGIAAAFKIWKDRTAELTKTLSQVEIPDAILQSGERINAATEAWEKFRLSLAGVRAEISGIEAAHQRTLGQLARSKDLVKQFMGGQLTPEADRVLARRKAASENVAAANLAIRGRSRISEASKLTGDLQARIASMDPAAVASLTQANEGAVTSAEGEITDRNARLKFLDQAADARWWNLGTNYKFWLRYGWGGNIADARKIEQGALGNAQTRAAAARHRLDLLKSGGAGTRAIQDRIDALTTGAASDFGRAAIGFQDARATDFNSQVAYGASRMERGLPLIASHTGGGLSVQPDVVALLRENLKLAAEIGRFAEQQNQVLKNILTRQTTHPE